MATLSNTRKTPIEVGPRIDLPPPGRQPARVVAAETKKRESKRRIILGAQKVASAQSREQFTAANVAAAANVSTATLYKHISDIEELRAHVVAPVADRYFPDLMEPGDLETTVRHVAEALAECAFALLPDEFPRPLPTTVPTQLQFDSTLVHVVQVAIANAVSTGRVTKLTNAERTELSDTIDLVLRGMLLSLRGGMSAPLVAQRATRLLRAYAATVGQS